MSFSFKSIHGGCVPPTKVLSRRHDIYACEDTLLLPGKEVVVSAGFEIAGGWSEDGGHFMYVKGKDRGLLKSNCKILASMLDRDSPG